MMNNTFFLNVYMYMKLFPLKRYNQAKQIGIFMLAS